MGPVPSCIPQYPSARPNTEGTGSCGLNAEETWSYGKTEHESIKAFMVSLGHHFKLDDLLFYMDSGVFNFRANGLISGSAFVNFGPSSSSKFLQIVDK